MDHIQQPRPPFQCWFSTGYVCRVGALVMAKSLIILVSTLAQSSSLTLTRLLYCSHEVGILTSLALWRSSCTCTMRTKWPWKNVAGLPNVCFRGFRFAGLPNPSTNHATVAATTQGAAVRGVLKKKNENAVRWATITKIVFCCYWWAFWLQFANFRSVFSHSARFYA